MELKNPDGDEKTRILQEIKRHIDLALNMLIFFYPDPAPRKNKKLYKNTMTFMRQLKILTLRLITFNN